jgi:Cof subfamily protein (haloacid dehalogenase superfamily)
VCRSIAARRLASSHKPAHDTLAAVTYRLLAMDLDGTLLRRDHTIDDADLAAIRELQAAGVTVTIITGRLQSGTVGPARTCAIEGAIACIEGSHVFEVASNRTHVHHVLDDAHKSSVRSTLSAHGLAAFVFEADSIRHDQAGAEYVSYIRTWSPNLRVVEADLAWQALPLATVAIGEPDAVAAAHAALRQHPGLHSVAFQVYPFPGKHGVMVRAAGATKGTALVELCRITDVPISEAVAIGDWTNDVPMFEVAGHSFVMGGAPDAIRTKATESLSRLMGTGGGVAEAVKRAWG